MCRATIERQHTANIVVNDMLKEYLILTDVLALSLWRYSSLFSHKEDNTMLAPIHVLVCEKMMKFLFKI